MDFGIALPHTGRLATPQAITEAALEAERSGCASVWVLERILRPLNPRPSPGQGVVRMPESYSNAYAPIETLTYVAAKTSRILLGTSVIDALFHAPAVLARRFATLDQLSGGRVIAGLGQGYAPEEFETANVPIRRRGAGFEEFIAAMRAAWAPDPVRFDGRFYRIAESQISPKPVRLEGPPIIIGGMSPAAVTRAARVADGLNPRTATWDEMGGVISQFWEAAQQAGRDLTKLSVIVRANTTVGEHPQPEPRPALGGSAEQIADDLARLQSLRVDHVFFDMGRFELPVAEQFRRLERVRRAFG